MVAQAGHADGDNLAADLLLAGFDDLLQHQARGSSQLGVVGHRAAHSFHWVDLRQRGGLGLLKCGLGTLQRLHGSLGIGECLIG